jgi:hypothetical protein
MSSQLISDRELGLMRQTVRTRLSSRAVVLRATEVETETGTRIDYLPVAGAVAAGVRDPTIGAELVLASRIQSSSVATILLPLHDDAGLAVTVRAQDRLAVTTTDPISGADSLVTLDVEGIQGRWADWPIVQRVVGRVLS